MMFNRLLHGALIMLPRLRGKDCIEKTAPGLGGGEGGTPGPLVRVSGTC